MVNALMTHTGSDPWDQPWMAPSRVRRPLGSISAIALAARRGQPTARQTRDIDSPFGTAVRRRSVTRLPAPAYHSARAGSGHRRLTARQDCCALFWAIDQRREPFFFRSFSARSKRRANCWRCCTSRSPRPRRALAAGQPVLLTGSEFGVRTPALRHCDADYQADDTRHDPVELFGLLGINLGTP